VPLTTTLASSTVSTLDEKSPDSSEAKPGTDELLHGNALYDQTSRALDDMLNTILDQEPSNIGLSAIFKHIEPWLTSVNEWERLRSIKSLSRTLKHFLVLSKQTKPENNEVNLDDRNFRKTFNEQNSDDFN